MAITVNDSRDRYLDVLLIMMNNSFKDHIEKLEVVLAKLLRVITVKSNFFMDMIQYLVSLVTCDGLTPISQIIKASSSQKHPKPKEIMTVLGLLQHCQDTEK